uniref:Uncharacterized protein n=1 Tax=Pelagomonas calceolata TaxID=35677 RepID=A0A7S4A5H5_9STRA
MRSLLPPATSTVLSVGEKSKHEVPRGRGNVRRRSPVTASRTMRLSAKSSAPMARSLPSQENATAWTPFCPALPTPSPPGKLERETTHARLKFVQLLLILAQRASSFSSTNFRMWYNASSGRDDSIVCVLGQ